MANLAERMAGFAQDEVKKIKDAILADLAEVIAQLKADVLAEIRAELKQPPTPPQGE